MIGAKMKITGVKYNFRIWLFRFTEKILEYVVDARTSPFKGIEDILIKPICFLKRGKC